MHEYASVVAVKGLEVRAAETHISEPKAFGVSLTVTRPAEVGMWL